MTSQINPNNINGAYPVAGQDNNSQGFRDNFTNTKTNFQAAAAEITDLQSKVVLKAALTGTTLNNNMSGAVISNVQLQGQSYSTVNQGSISTTIPINVSAGSFQLVTPTSPVTISFSNWPSAGQMGSVIVQFTITDSAYTLTLPSAVGSGNSATSLIGIEGRVGQIITFAQTGTYSFSFTSSDNGSTIYVEDLTRPRSYFTNNVTMLGNLSVSGNIYANISGNLTAGGSNTNIQFNDNGTANGTSGLTFVKTSNTLAVGNAITATGNISGSYFIGNGSQLTGIVANTIGTLTTLTVTGNVQSGNTLSSGILSATGNIRGGNILTAGLSSSTGNVFGGNLISTSLVSAGTNLVATNSVLSSRLSVSGNIIGSGATLFNGSAELFANNAVNLSVTSSYFSTTTNPEAATLAAGTEGQVIVLAMYADSGDMVITAANPAWGGAGTITFTAIGQACTLQYINSKWFVIGNNGATFA